MMMDCDMMVGGAVDPWGQCGIDDRQYCPRPTRGSGPQDRRRYYYYQM